MRPRRVVAPDEALEVFDLAVREQALVVVTTQEADEWLTFKSRFLERDPNQRFFVLDYEPQREGDALAPIAPGQYVGISFRHKSRKMMFSTVVEAKGRFVTSPDTTISAVRYRWPSSMTELQRRAYFRTPIPNGTQILASVWLGGTTARAQAQQAPLEVLTGELADLSCGGTLLRLNGSKAPAWRDNGTVGIEIQLPDGKPPITINANFRGARLDDEGRLGLAVQFVGLELDVDGRVVLQRLSATIQRLHRLSQSADIAARKGGWGF
jgi:c-di-GMP-binding flagellar brake protein YcgR